MVQTFTLHGNNQFVLLEDYKKLAHKLDEVVWGHHLDERVACDCDHCDRYNRWLERKS